MRGGGVNIHICFFLFCFFGLKIEGTLVNNKGKTNEQHEKPKKKIIIK